MANLALLGLGKVGLPLAAHFAAIGHTVVGVDTNPKLIEMLHAGADPLPWEPGTSLADRRGIVFTTDLRLALDGVDAAVIIVPTPQMGDRLDDSVVEKAVREVWEHDREIRVCIASTLDPRSAWLLNNHRIAYTPVMIRLGHVREDLRNASLFLLGVYGGLDMAGWARGIWYPEGYSPTNLVHEVFANPTTIAVAKLAINATLSSRIAWANDVAERAQSFGADPDVVLKTIGLDPRIGPAFLRKGWGPSGPCLPRDMDVWCSVKGLGLAEIMLATHRVSNRQILDRVEGFVRGLAIANPKVLILGATYNPGAMDVTESLGLAVFRVAIARGWQPHLMDPALLLFGEGLLREIGERRSDHRYAQEYVAEWADAVILATPWPEFRALDFGKKPMLDLTWDQG